MTHNLRGHDVPVTAAFTRRFLAQLVVIDAVGTALLFVALSVTLSRPIAGDYAAAFLALRNEATYFFPIVAFAALAFVLLVGMATAVVCVVALQKVAGPVYRMERLLESCLAGEPVMPAFFREGDQVKALASSFNGFIGRIREDRQKWLGTMEHAERLCFQDRATCRREMEKALADLELLMTKYR